LVYEGLETNNLFKELRSAEHAMLIARATEDAREGPRAWAALHKYSELSVALMMLSR